MGHLDEANWAKNYPDDLNKDNKIKTGQDYFTIPVVNLKIDQPYSFNFQWVYADGTVSPWSDGLSLTTAKLPTLTAPKFLPTDLTYFQGILNITWGGLDANGQPYTKAFDRINIYIKDETLIGSPYRLVGFLKSAGTIRVAVPPRAHSVKLTVVSLDGAESDFSTAQFETPTLTPPNQVTGISTAWLGSTYVVSFNSDPSSPGNEYLKEYEVTLIGANYTIPFPLRPVAGSQQRFTLTLDQNKGAFGTPELAFTGGRIRTVDIYDNYGSPTLFTSSGSYVSPLSAPTISVTETVNGYKVAYTPQTSTDFKLISIEEVVSDSVTAPTTGFVGVATGTSNPITVSSGVGKRWVRAKLYDQSGATHAGYSNVVQVTPTDIVAAAVDAEAPGAIQSATAVGAADPSDSGGTLGIITLSIVNSASTVPSDFNGYIVKIIRSSDSKEWTQQFNSKTYLTSLPVNLGISVGQTYTLSVATTDGRNQSAFVSVTGNPISVNDTRSNTTVATNLVLSATDSILTVKWTPSSDINVASYRVQLTTNADTSFASPIQEVYANSNLVSFGGLDANTTYRVRVTSKFGGPAGALSTNHLSGTATLNASGAISDQIRPNSNPTPTVKSLFKAFALYWDPIDNNDPVTYEVYAKTVNSTGIVDPSNLVMEIDGTFAVINALASGAVVEYPAETSPTSATDYYFAIRAKDADGLSTAAVVSVGPFTASRTGQFDIATNAIYANHITAGQINADKMTTDLLFVDKTINVGESTSLNRIRLDSTIASPVTMNDFPSGTFPVKSRIYIGAGNYYSSGTSFYADNTGRFSIGDKLRFDGTDLTVNGSGTFTGLLTTGTGSNLIKVGTGANGANNGLYIQQGGQYIYTDGTFSFGGGSLTGTASSLSVSGTMTVKGNSELQGDLKLVSPGVFYIGANKASGQRLLINDEGIAAYNSGGTRLFSLDTTGAIDAQSGLIGGWSLGTSAISKTSGTNTISLSSSTNSISATGTNYTSGFGLPDANNIVFWAGGSRDTSANFYVTSNGSVVMKSATITGYASSGDLDSKANTSMNNVTSIDGGKITTGIIKGSTHSGTTDGSDFATAGMAINLTNGGMSSKNFRINSNGDAFFNGTLSAGVSISSPSITGGTIGGATITVSDSFTSSGLYSADDNLTEGSDNDANGSVSTIGSGTTSATLSITGGKISSNSILRLEGASYTEILSGGTQSAMFSNTRSSMQFTTGLYLGDPAKSSQSNVQSTSSSRVPWISLDASLRLRKGAPLLYPGGTAGAYVRNIYIKQTSATTISNTTGNIGDIYITY